MKRTGILIFGTVFAVLLATAPASGADAVTVGDFVREIAALRALPSDTPETALASLRAAGIDVAPPALDRTLTERDVAEIVGALGVPVVTSSPDRVFGRDQVERFFVTMTPELSPSKSRESADSPGPYPRPNDRAADPATKGKGKKKGLPTSPSAPM
jgi:hypothetical protein